MNINFKSQPEPQFNHNMPQNNQRYTPSRSSDGTYFLSRHVPHPRMVCHIRGLNNAPICVVREKFLRERASPGKTEIMERTADQQHVLPGNITSNASTNNYFPRLEACLRRGLGSSQSGTQHGEEGLGDIAKGIPNTPNSLKKLVKKRLQTSAPPATSQGIHAASHTLPSSPFTNLHHNPHIHEDMNYTPSYLDQGIKVLEKFCKVLQTDSLAEIQGWLSRASIKEKNFVSDLIRSELTGKDLLNYQPPAINEGTTENMNIQSLKKPHPPLWGDAEEEMNQSRPSTKESEASQNKKQGK
ncbi:uncharacterized protein C4orf17 homolog [Rhea pennata]|uniref:uncharacterized protein C4orf17 homolog n=1 Tax=Rhea pennata TaxID=8795 RepID=UPI002E25F372